MSPLWQYFPFFLWCASMVLHVLLLFYILHRRGDSPPEKTFWLLMVGLLPGIGTVFFLFFGASNGYHTSMQVAQEQQKTHDPAILTRLFGETFHVHTNALQEFIPRNLPPDQLRHKLLDRLFPESLALTGNYGEILTDGTAVYPRMLHDIRQARHSIRLQSFILMSDTVGNMILQELRAKAAEGVDVKILFDSFGSFFSYFSKMFRDFLLVKDPHFAMRPFSQFAWAAPWKIQLRNHRKLLIIDGTIAYSGGINISEENEHSPQVPRERRIHDLHCRITGPAVSQFTLSFFRDWAYVNRKHLTRFAVPEDFPMPLRTGDTVIRVLAGGPGNRNCGTRDLFFAAAALAQRSLTIITPYLVPGQDYVEMLRMAAARGVDVRIIVPRHNNHGFVALASRSFYGNLLRSGVRIYEKKGDFSHIKALLVDQEWGFMGSSNCDNRSFRLNYELDFCFEGGNMIKDMREQIEQELQDSEAVDLYTVEHRNFVQRIAQNLCALLSPIL